MCSIDRLLKQNGQNMKKKLEANTTFEKVTGYGLFGYRTAYDEMCLNKLLFHKFPELEKVVMIKTRLLVIIRNDNPAVTIEWECVTGGSVVIVSAYSGIRATLTFGEVTTVHHILLPPWLPSQKLPV
ncbi:8873_t:CDS:2 [Ambispora gerdemannii]|uniref:8873_t:CDS:1 n=1 Tax=Ambispora gerdemannii TaxID=144530 RepID=A0A9N8VEW5_9GLOM|nr:8873_t:CDS:2 [Ambispora gerdemannii]